MTPGDIPLTLPEAAALLMAALRRHGWTIDLDAAGRLHAIIGDPLEGRTIADALEALDLLKDQCRLVLSETRGIH